jgi:hypothetical protein
LRFQNFANLGLVRTEHVEEVLIGFKMIVLGVQDRLADATEELGEHGAGAGLGGALALAPALADGDEALWNSGI